MMIIIINILKLLIQKDENNIYDNSSDDSSEDIIMELDNNIEKIFNNLTIEENKDIKTNFLINNDIIFACFRQNRKKI